MALSSATSAHDAASFIHASVRTESFDMSSADLQLHYLDPQAVGTTWNAAFPRVQQPSREGYVVDFDGPGDPAFPQNWPMRTSLILTFTCVSSTFDSAIFSPSMAPVAKHFGVGAEVTAPATLVAMLGFGIFNTAVAVSKYLQTLMICHFFGGVLGSSPLINVAAIFADMYDNCRRGIAIALFANTVFLGPLIAPCVGGFINESYLGWRWTAYIPSFMGYAAYILNLLFLKET
ncbi:hypothetical protein N8T08_008596 [Aspergillus melleus]|uniref:Uncharacterized protein n=1 Tax=Aspergillus melleus TaxID=138277 RepID=A0ACC3BD72_9EURO|nr:hypothetical protein N8T08_008596 [Aspergillus melleus]